jgi:outer membrane cobalamin receptor
MLPVCLLLLASSAVPPSDDDDKTETPSQAATRAPEKTAADEDDDEGKAQPDTTVVITGRKLDVARTQINPELGATVYSLGNEAIDDRPGGETTSMANMLAQFPGVSFSGESLTIRGSKDTQVRINDVIVPEALSDPADHLSARLAQSIRVMTGTLPAQYGFVPGGVISVTTKSGLYRHGGELEFYGGSEGFYDPAVEWAGSAFGTSVFASGSFENRRVDIADLTGSRTRDRRKEFEGLAFADHILGPSDRVSFILGGSHERHRIGETSLPAGVEEAGDGYGVGTYQHSGDGFALQTSLFFGGATNEAVYVQSTRERRTTSGTQIDGSYNLGSSHTLRGGLLFNHSINDETELGGERSRFKRNSVGVYFQDEWRLTPRLTFNPGVRVDWLRGFSASGSVEPRGSLVWTHPNGFTAHVGYAHYAASAPLGEEEGAVPLPKEHDDYLDGGVQYHSGALTLGADAYLRRTKNLLLEQQIIGSAVAQSFAFKQSRFRGLELSANYATHALSAWLNVSLSRARARSLIDNEGLFTSVTMAATDARWTSLSSERPVTVSSGVTWRSGKLALSGTAQASSGAVYSRNLAEPNGGREHGYATFGLSAVYHAGLGGRLSDFRVDLTNATNTRYRLNQATNLEGGWTRWTQGRAITLGIEQGF